MKFPTISITELEQYMDENRPIEIIDLRNRASFEICHLKGAVNVPYQELEQAQYSLPRNKTLVFYCSRGGQSMMACNILSSRGFQVVNVANGIAFYQGKYLVRT